MTSQPTLHSRDHMFRYVRAIADAKQMDWLKNLDRSHLVESGRDDTKKFASEFMDWILQSSEQRYVNLDEYKTLEVTLGVTHSIDQLITSHRNSRFRVFRGEYVYTLALFKLYNCRWDFIDSTQSIEPDDVVIVSDPFSSSGCRHPLLESVMAQTERCGAQLIIDAAYFGTTFGLPALTLSPSVTHILFSMSKFSPLASQRLGLRVTRKIVKDGITLLNDADYLNSQGAYLGRLFFKQFDAGYLQKTYFEKYRRLLRERGWKETNTLLLATSDSGPEDLRRENGVFRFSTYSIINI